PEEVLPQLAESIPASREFAALAARKKMLEGQVHSILGHAEVADALIEEAHQKAEAAGAEDVIMDVETIRGPILFNHGRPEEGERVLQAALLRAHAARAEYVEGSVLVNLGWMYLRRHRYDAAAGYFERASEVSGPRFSILYSAAQTNLAVCY